MLSSSTGAFRKPLAVVLIAGSCFFFFWLATLVPALAEEPQAEWQRLFDRSVFYFSQGLYREAREAAEQAFGIIRDLENVGEEDRVRAREMLIGLYHYNGETDKAQELQQAASGMRVPEISRGGLDRSEKSAGGIDVLFESSAEPELQEFINRFEKALNSRDEETIRPFFAYHMIPVVTAGEMSRFGSQNYSALSFVKEWVGGAPREIFFQVPEVKVYDGIAWMQVGFQERHSKVLPGTAMFSLVKTSEGWVITAFTRVFRDS